MANAAPAGFEPAASAAVAGPAVPGHFWAVAIVAVLCNTLGAYDYTMTQLGDADYLAQFTPEQRGYFASLPLWLSAAWAVGVWGSMAGSLLLVARSRWAVAAFQAALLGLALSTLAPFATAMPEGLRTPAMLVVNVVIWAALLLFLWYAARMRRRGILR